MNEELLGYTYELIQQNGYDGSMEDFVVELEENKDLQDVSYEILKSKGYDAEESEFIEEFGLGKTKDVVVEDATVTSKPVASEKIKDTDLKLVNGSLERVVVDPDGGVQSAYDQYKEMTKNDPSNYNVESKIGQFLIDKIAGFTSGSLGILGGAADAIEMVGDVAATKGIDVYNYFADDENDFTQEERNKIAGNIEKAFALDDLLNIGADATSKFMTKRDAADGEGITGAIKEGNYLEALDRTLSGMFQAAPSVVAAIVPGGLGLIGASSVGQHYEEKTEDNSENRGLKSMLGSLGQGIIELASERVTRGLFKGVNPLLKGGLGKKMAKSITGRVLGGMVAEGTSEVGSEELNNTIDLLWDIDKFHDENGDFDGKKVLTRMADTYIISSLIGGVTTGGVELSDLGKAVQADRLMSPGVQSEIKKISADIQANEINNRNINNKALKNKKIQLEAKRKKINNINKEVVDNLSKDQKLNILALKQETEETKVQLEDKNLTESQKESLKGVIKENNSKINDIYNSKMNELVNQRRDKQTKILNSLDILGINLTKTELNQKEYDERLKKDQIEQVKKSKLSKEEKEKKINDILKQKENNTAAYVKGKDVIINEEAFESITDLGDSGLSVKSHELLHPILDKLIGNSDQQGKLVEQFKKQLTNNQRVIMDGLLKGRDYTEKEIATEYFTVFSDAILSGDIVYEENFGTTIKNFWESLVRTISPNKLKEVSFKDGKQAYEFIKEYNNSIKKGKLSDAVIVATKKDDQAKTKDQELKKSKNEVKEAYKELQQIEEAESNFTQQPEILERQAKRKKELLKIVQDENAYEELRQIDEFEADFKPTKESTDRKKELLDLINKEEEQEIIKFSKNEKASDEVQRLFDEKPRDWEFKVIEQMRPITAKLAERRRDVTGFDRQLLIDEIETGERGILDLIRSYDPNKNDSLAAYINTFLSFRAQEGSKRVLKEVFESDVTEERSVSAQEDDISIEDAVDESIKPTQEEKSKLRRQIKLSDEQVEKVRQAVRKTFGTKLPPPDSPKFKKALRKAFDTELFKELKTNVFKSRDDYNFFMSQNWKALYDAIPQETLNQSFAPFREAVLDETGKQKREKTPEGERIFRKKDITKEEFLDYFFSPDLGVSTRGTRKDAIVRMAAQELGFDATMETIKEPKVAEKIEFANPDIKTPELSETIDRKQELKFARIPITEKLGIKKFDKFDELNENEKYNKIISINREEFLIDEKTGKKITKGKGNELIKEKVVKDLIEPGLLNDELSPELRDYLIYSLTGIGKQKIPQGLTSGLAFGRGGYLYPNIASAKNALRLEKEVLDKLKESPEYQKAFKLAGTKAQTTSKIPKSVVTKLKTDKKLQKEILEENEYKKTTLKDILKGFAKVAQKETELSDHVNHLIGLQSYYQGHFIRRLIPFVSFTDPSIRKNFKGHDEHFSKALETAKFAQYMIDRAATDPDYLTSGKFDTDYDLLWKGAARGLITQQAGKRIDAKGKKTGKRTTISESPLIELYNSLTPTERKNHFLLPNTQFNPSSEIVSIDEIKFAKKEKKVKEKTKSEIDLEKANSKLNKDFNEIIANNTSIAASTTISEAKARLAGEKRKRFRFFIPPSADDLVGLLYYTLGKGKIGEAQLKWYNQHIISPFAQAMEAVSRDRNETARRFNKIVKDLGIIPKNLRKEIPGDVFTKEQAIRVYIWNKQGMKIPGLSKIDQANLLKYMDNNPDLKEFGDKIITINRGYEYAKPGEGWLAGTITSDLKETLNTTKRAAYLQQWQRNVDTIFSKENLNKLEAAYGRQYRLAVENILQRMKTGRNRDFAGDKLTTRFVDWINGSVGAIMFFNTRSAILQTLSAANFINFSDNNVFAAAKAFANQKQYWSDFKMLFNSDFLVDRRQGLRMDINEADLATAAKQGGTRGVISKLLKLGFTPTQIADSFAIAAGGSTFYRNRLKSLMKDGMDQKAAEKIAFQEFRETAEESQQSSRPDKISQQQAGPLGRIILAFANTPSQYARITKKAFLDLKNGRGDAKTNISKIVYYTFAQNLIFNAAQQALFAISFADNDEEEEKLKDKKLARVANGMADSVLRGLGFGGAIASTVKNIAIKLEQQSKKKNPEYQDAMLDIFKISPPVSSKITKLKSAGRAYDWNKKEMIEEGVSINNPAALALGELTSALTNVPLDRAIRKIQNVDASITDDLDFYQRLALLGGWNKWDLGIQNKKKKRKKLEAPKDSGTFRRRTFKD